MLGKFSCFVVVCRLFSKSFFFRFKQNLIGTLSKCQMVWIQIRTDRKMALILVQSLCKKLSADTKVIDSKVRVKHDKLAKMCCNRLTICIGSDKDLLCT